MRAALKPTSVCILAAFWMAACSVLGPRLEKPEVFLLGVTPLESTMFEHRIETLFRLRNPNDVDLDVSGLDLELRVNGVRLARVLSGEATRVPRFGEATLKAVASASTIDILRQLEKLRSAAQPTYEISGYVYLGRALGRRRVKLDTSGKLLPD